MKNKRCWRLVCLVPVPPPGIQDTCSRVPVLLCLVHASSMLDISQGNTFLSFPCQNFLQVVEDVSGTLFRVETAIIITMCSWRCLTGYILLDAVSQTLGTRWHQPAPDPL